MAKGYHAVVKLSGGALLLRLEAAGRGGGKNARALKRAAHLWRSPPHF